MSLTLALNTALSGLQVNQAAIQVTSNNITNANTPGYSRKISNMETVVLGNIGAGVNLANVTRQIDSYLSREARSSSSELAILRAQNAYQDQVQALFGAPGAGNSISNSLDQFESALQAVATAADDPTLRSQVLSKGLTVARQLNDMSRGVQNLRLQADRDIAEAINIINDQLNTISSLNGEIGRLKGLGQPTAELEDQRDMALNTLAEQMDVSTFTRPTGEIVVLNRSGHMLVDGPAYQLSYTPVAGMSASTTYNPPGGITGVMLDNVDITKDFRSGRIAGLLELRDTILPTMGKETHQLAQSLRDAINKAHNDGVGLPAATKLESSRPQTGTASVTSDFTIALLNSDGTSTASATISAPASLDATSLAAAINAALGSPVASAAGGVLTINGGTQGIALSGGTVDLGGGATTSLSDFFHLNDFFVGDNPGDQAAVIAVRSDIASNANLISRGRLRQDAITGNQYVSIGDGAVASALANIMSSPTTFAAAGGLPAMNRTIADYGAAIISKNANEGDSLRTRLESREAMTEQLKLQSQSLSGVNMDEEMANLISLQTAYSASARLVTTVSDMFDVLLSIAR